MKAIFPSDLIMGVVQAAHPREAAAAAARLQPEASDVGQKFEAVMLRRMVEDMLPKDTSSLYGEGTAGNIWRSLQADLMSQEMAKAGGIGIARMLEKSQARLGVQDSASLNTIEPRLSAALSGDSEWPYFNSTKRRDGAA